MILKLNLASIFSIGGSIPVKIISSDSEAFFSFSFSHADNASLTDVPLLILYFKGSAILYFLNNFVFLREKRILKSNHDNPI